MPPAAPQQQSPQGDNALAPLWITVLLFLAAGLTWYLGHTYIVAFVYKIKLLQGELIGLFTSGLKQTLDTMRIVNPADVTFSEMANVSDTIGQYMRYPIIAILAVFAILLYINDITARFKKTYTMKSLADAEQTNWPQIKCVLKLDLVSQDIDQGPWAMAMTPMQFAKKYQLLQEEPTVITDQMLMRKAKPTVSLLRGKTKEMFTLQLGRYWEGADALNMHSKALFAVFAARINRDRDGPANLLKQISHSVDKGKLDFSGVPALLNKHKNSKLVQNIVQKHAFFLTVMASMLTGARNDGVIATAEFLWLKPVDRSLWYILNSVGRQTPFIEVAGPYAHWLAEKELGRRIMVPMVEEAVNALDIAIKEVIYVPDSTD